MWRRAAASLAVLRRDDGCAWGSRTKLAVVYADSPHIHLLQSVANQSKVRDNKNRAYTKPKTVIDLCMNIEYKSQSRLSCLFFFSKQWIFKKLSPPQPSLKSLKHKGWNRKRKHLHLENSSFLSLPPFLSNNNLQTRNTGNLVTPRHLYTNMHCIHIKDLKQLLTHHWRGSLRLLKHFMMQF